MSLDTNSSSVAMNTPLHLSLSPASVNILFISSTVVSLFVMKVISAIDPAGVGTRMLIPSKFPSHSGMALVTAIATPVELGTIFCAAARPSRQSFLLGPSTMDCEAV